MEATTINAWDKHDGRQGEKNVNWAGDINIKYTSTVVNREAQECSVAATDGSLAVSICLIAAPGIKIQVHDILRLSYWKVSLYSLFMKIFIIY